MPKPPPADPARGRPKGAGNGWPARGRPASRQPGGAVPVRRRGGAGGPAPIRPDRLRLRGRRGGAPARRNRGGRRPGAGVSITGTPTVRIGLARPGPDTGQLPDPVLLGARRVVMATGTPTLHRGLVFTRVRPERSYILAYRRAAPGAGELPRDMLISVDGPRRSLRTTTSPDGTERLLVGGASHGVGRDPDGPQAKLRAWANRMFPGLPKPMRGPPRTTPPSAGCRWPARWEQRAPARTRCCSPPGSPSGA